MNGIQRVKQAIGHDRQMSVARGEFVLDRQFAKNFLTWKSNGCEPDMRNDTDLLIACCRALKLDLVCLQSNKIFGEAPECRVLLEDIPRFSDEGLFVFWIVDGVFQTVVQRLGLMAVFREIAESPDALFKELERMSDQVMSSMIQGVCAGAHGIIIADDIAYNQGTYISPSMVEQYLKPFWEIQTMKAAELGVPVFFHSDGNLDKVLPAIASAGFAGLQCIESAAGMDIGKIKVRYNQSLCLMGGLDPSLLDQGRVSGDRHITCGHLHREMKALMTSDGSQGGYIFGTCCGLHAGMSPELVDLAYRLSFEFERTQMRPNSSSMN
ncbi:MAG: hypothetical protein HKM93_12590 [Desulfobacteraceae bacterium]|nr:hypothetical protein [Desulfobacteraceae bacterium]